MRTTTLPMERNPNKLMLCQQLKFCHLQTETFMGSLSSSSRDVSSDVQCGSNFSSRVLVRSQLSTVMAEKLGDWPSIYHLFILATQLEDSTNPPSHNSSVSVQLQVPVFHHLLSASPSQSTALLATDSQLVFRYKSVHLPLSKPLRNIVCTTWKQIVMAIGVGENLCS